MSYDMVHAVEAMPSVLGTKPQLGQSERKTGEEPEPGAPQGQDTALDAAILAHRLLGTPASRAAVLAAAAAHNERFMRLQTEEFMDRTIPSRTQ